MGPALMGPFFEKKREKSGDKFQNDPNPINRKKKTKKLSPQNTYGIWDTQGTPERMHPLVRQMLKV